MCLFKREPSGGLWEIRGDPPMCHLLSGSALSTPPLPLTCQRGHPVPAQGSPEELRAFVLSGHVGRFAATVFSKRRVKERTTVYLTAEETPALPARPPACTVNSEFEHAIKAPAWRVALASLPKIKMKSSEFQDFHRQTPEPR